MTGTEFDWRSIAKVPKFENTEVADEAEFTWQINDWTQLEDRQVSPRFECGGYLWQILLFPRGNPQRGCISLYLNAAGPANTSESDADHSSANKEPQLNDNWHACASFALAMWNPDHPEVTVTQASNHRFTQKVNDWGYNEFSVLRPLFTRAPGAPAPLIMQRGEAKQLQVNISARVEVLADPSGVLWHDFQDYDSRQTTGYTGLVNQGATCYLNSLLQSLYFTRAFRNAVYQIPDSSGVTGGLQRLFYMLSTSHPPVDTTDLTTTFGWDSADAFTQHDVQELARVLMDRLESKMKNTSVDGFLSKLFVGQMKSFIKCINVPFESARTEDFWDVQLNVRGMPNVYASFRDYCTVETLEGDNQYAAGEYGLQDAEKGVVFESLPPVLHLQLKRYDYDWMRDIEIKVNDRYEFPLDLDLSEFVENEGPWQYDLHGVLVHSGDLNAGHYYALIKPESDGDWFKFDDDRVTKATLREVLDMNYGGNEGALLQRVTSAYMLVYVRRDAKSFVFPTGEADVAPPPEIAQRIEADRAAEVVRRKALEEQQQYMTLRTLAVQNFKYHRGPGILPGPATSTSYSDEHEEPMKLKVRIGTRLTGLAKQLDAGSLWLYPLAHTNQLDARARPRKLHHVPITDGYYVDHLAEWVSHPSPVVFVGPAPPAAASQPDSEGRYRLVFIKRLEKDDLRGADAAWIDTKKPLRETLASILGFNLGDAYLETSTPTSRHIARTESFVLPLDTSKTGFELGIEPSDIIVVGDGQSIVDYFDRLANQVTLLLTPLYEEDESGDSDSDDSGLQTGLSETAVTISMRDSYETVLSKVSEAINADPAKLQLHSLAAGWQRSVPIKSTGDNLAELWGHSASHTVRVLYRRISVPLADFEQMTEVSVIWLPEGYLGQAQQKTLLGKPADVPSFSSEHQTIIWVSQFGKNSKELNRPTLSVLSSFQSQNLSIHAAPLPALEEKARTVSKVRPCGCFQFTKDAARTHGVPFQIALVPEEEFKDTKLRIFELLRHHRDSDRSLEKIKFAVVRDRSDPKYISDESVVLYDAMTEGELIGLDHPDRRRAAYHQQAIHID